MAMLSSCTTLLSRAPGKSSPAAALQLRRSRQQPAAVAALRWGSRKESQSRAAIFARYALEQDKYNIEPSALVHPRAFASSDWSLGEDPNRITLSFNVGDLSTTDEELEVATTEDQTLLVIRYKEKKQKDKSSSSPSPASSLDVRLLMPPGYDANKMQGIMLNTGWLEISIPRPSGGSATKAPGA